MSSDFLFILSISFALIVIAAMVIKSLIDKKNHTLTVKNFFIASGITVFVLIFPQYYLNYNGELPTSLVYSALFSFKSITFSQSFEYCRNNVPENNIVYVLYYALTYIDYILVPFFTLSFLVEIFGNAVDAIKLSLMRKRKAIVFSELNDISLNIAKTLEKSEPSRIVFCNFSLKNNKGNRYIAQARKLSAVIVEKKSTDIHFPKHTNQIVYYEVSQDKNINLNHLNTIVKTNEDTCEKRRKNITIKIFTDGKISECYIESIMENSDNKNIRVEIIDEIRNSCYRLLYREPLFKNIDNNISVLIIGTGTTGIELLKASAWCGQLLDKGLKITVVDADSKTKAMFLNECPELTPQNGYNVNFINCNVKEETFYSNLSAKCSDATYIIVCMKDDDLNISTAMRLREHYEKAKIYNPDFTSPTICVRVKDSQKNDNIKDIKYGNIHYNLIPFGSYSEIFSESNIENRELSTLSKLVNFAYCVDSGNNFAKEYKQKFKEITDSYYRDFYSQRSSLATAIHIIYKLYSIGADTCLPNYKEKNIDELRKIIENNSEKLAELEHRRWMAYMRSEGYSTASVDDVRRYCRITNGKHRFDAAKMHPCLVPWDELDNLHEELSNIEGIKPVADFKTSDVKICQMIPDMIAILNNNRGIK